MKVLDEEVEVDKTYFGPDFHNRRTFNRKFKDHQWVLLKEQEFVQGATGINGIEGFWGYARKRRAKLHGMSASNFISYLKEIEFRFNYSNKDSEYFIDSLLEVLIGHHSVLKKAD